MPRALLLLLLPAAALAFPDGAPIDVCVKARRNQPHHGQARPRVDAPPYSVTASADTYSPGDKISVVITSLDGTPFRGFFMQARDAASDEWLGAFEAAENINLLPECSSITHADNKDKLQATLIWTAPAQGMGNVYFTGAVVQQYDTFWADLVAEVARAVRQ
ncbi:putative defense protein 3 [Bacillus rossius redtenbacheri]|uniref:putative defense protein 3 n=1 Tax=Bacillus rossius redtenbacheri TaxID=93214 RepID=UPI002FDD5A11